jgi:hypothetical protein
MNITTTAGMIQPELRRAASRMRTMSATPITTSQVSGMMARSPSSSPHQRMYAMHATDAATSRKSIHCIFPRQRGAIGKRMNDSAKAKPTCTGRST